MTGSPASPDMGTYTLPSPHDSPTSQTFHTQQRFSYHNPQLSQRLVSPAVGPFSQVSPAPLERERHWGSPTSPTSQHTFQHSHTLSAGSHGSITLPTSPPRATFTRTTRNGREQGEPRQRNLGARFSLEWLRIVTVPFSRTHGLRNPWNKDREIKVSRDGMELEPGVGQALLDLFDTRDLGNTL